MSDDFLIEFLDESRQYLAKAEAVLLSFVPGKPVDPEAVNAAFRALHTIKGGAGFWISTGSRN